MKLFSPELRLAKESCAPDGWYGFDLDGTLAYYDYWRGVDHIGEPIMPMIVRLKQYLNDGYQCKIFTARVAGENPDHVRAVINAWLMSHIGQTLEITNIKDMKMIGLFDDRAIRVITNTGLID